MNCSHPSDNSVSADRLAAVRIIVKTLTALRSVAIGSRRLAGLAILGLATTSSPLVWAQAQEEETRGQQTVQEPDPAARGDDGEGLEHPYTRRIPFPDFPKDQTWINTRPLDKRSLRGKFVLLDFWTYCCINCLHILPELKKLERAYPDQLVVIGVHSAKFETERDVKNIREAVLRYEIEHPVLVDSDHGFWRQLGIRSWPTVLLIDPEGNFVWGKQGETTFEEVKAVLDHGLPYYRRTKRLDETPVRFELEAYKVEPTPLRFPGKILADERGGRLFITDSNHNRIVVTSLAGKLLRVIGSGREGAADGPADQATFNHPQGLALDGQLLYVADTENHLIRRVNLETGQVQTLAGTGIQSRKPWFGKTFDPGGRWWAGKPLETALNSPWALWVHGGQLYIAMAGPHQIWRLAVDGSEIALYAGNGREDIVDGALRPELPYEEGDPRPNASFAQPSGLTSDGQWLYVADSEGSAVRAVPLADPQAGVKTLVGTRGSLFDFGDVDGPADRARLQHVLGITYRDGALYVADTYNNKIKRVDARSGEVTTLAGTREAGQDDAQGTFDEPAGIAVAGNTLYVADTNNHLIRTVDLATRRVGRLKIEGLQPPQLESSRERVPDFRDAARVRLPAARRRAVEGAVKLDVELVLPVGWKLNTLAPLTYYVLGEKAANALDDKAWGRKELDPPRSEFQLTLPVRGDGQAVFQLAVVYFYCEQGGLGLCKVGSVVFDVPLTIAADGEAKPLAVRYEVPK